MVRILLAIVAVLSACSVDRVINIPSGGRHISGSEFYKETAGFGWRARDSVAIRYLSSGGLPSFLRKFARISVSTTDQNGKTIRATYFVSPDYVSVGNNSDWARIPLTPMAAQRIADTFKCFLPTRKIVNDIYANAKVKLEPVPLYAFRDSTPTMYHHHLILEGQRKNAKGLIAGIKKDVVISSKITKDTRPNRVAIYGWHKPDGKPIQPLYTGHVNWYVDYSHGIRLIYRRMKVNGKWLDYIDVLKDPVLRKLICDEEECDFYRY
jgi:hypothetical protein